MRYVLPRVYDRIDVLSHEGLVLDIREGSGATGHDDDDRAHLGTKLVQTLRKDLKERIRLRGFQRRTIRDSDYLGTYIAGRRNWPTAALLGGGGSNAT